MAVSRVLTALVAAALLPSGTGAQTTSTISSNFNGIAIAPGSDLWFTAVFSVRGQNPSVGGTVRLVNSSITFIANGVTYHVAVPDAVFTFSPTATVATTSFNVALNRWETTAPLSFQGDAFLAGVALPLPGGLPGGGGAWPHIDCSETVAAAKRPNHFLVFIKFVFWCVPTTYH